MKTLELFNAVVSSSDKKAKPYINTELGIFVMPEALDSLEDILNYYNNNKLSGNDLNKSFHKSWAKIKNSSTEELAMEQIMHYYYAFVENKIFIPKESLKIPDTDLVFKVVRGLSKEDITEECLKLLKSGIALTDETIDNVLSVLIDELGYSFSGKENITNKEAVAKLASKYNVLPNDPTEFFRCVVYAATGETLLIKNDDLINKIKSSKYSPAPMFTLFGLDKLAQIFNRFKPLFLAFKSKCPAIINKISKLSKTKHKPLVVNALNEVTTRELSLEDTGWLDNATPYALFKALQACKTREKNQDTFIYKIRNGKSFVKDGVSNVKVCKYNRRYLENYLSERFKLKGKKVFLPENIKFGLPTSEKMFVGNLPYGTKIISKRLAVGVYWEDSWGATDLDLSAVNVRGKVGWDRSAKQNGELFFSGDIVGAPNGAVEYLYGKNLSSNSILLNNVFTGDPNCKFKFIVGEGDKMSRKYMMNPSNLIVEEKIQSKSKETILGMFSPYKDDRVMFIVFSASLGRKVSSSNNPVTLKALEALSQQWASTYSFNKLLKLLGAEIVDDPETCDYDFTLSKLNKNSFVELFS